MKLSKEFGFIKVVTVDTTHKDALGNSTFDEVTVTLRGNRAKWDKINHYINREVNITSLEAILKCLQVQKMTDYDDQTMTGQCKRCGTIFHKEDGKPCNCYDEETEDAQNGWVQ